MLAASYQIETLADWDRYAALLAQELQPGAIVGLSGPLGAGKTTFTQALARVLGAEGEPRSPTFSLMRTYTITAHPSVRRLIHVDAYRIEKSSDLLALNLEEELAEPGTVLVIEWPENILSWLERQRAYYLLTISVEQNEVRAITAQKKER